MAGMSNDALDLRTCDDPTVNLLQKLRCVHCVEYFDAERAKPRSLRCRHALCEACLSVQVMASPKIDCNSCGVTTTLANSVSVDQLAVDEGILAMVRFLIPRGREPEDLQDIDVVELLRRMRRQTESTRRSAYNQRPVPYPVQRPRSSTSRDQVVGVIQPITAEVAVFQRQRTKAIRHYRDDPASGGEASLPVVEPPNGSSEMERSRRESFVDGVRRSDVVNAYHARAREAAERDRNSSTVSPLSTEASSSANVQVSLRDPAASSDTRAVRGSPAPEDVVAHRRHAFFRTEETSRQQPEALPLVVERPPIRRRQENPVEGSSNGQRPTARRTISSLDVETASTSDSSSEATSSSSTSEPTSNVELNVKMRPRRRTQRIRSVDHDINPRLRSFATLLLELTDTQRDTMCTICQQELRKPSSYTDMFMHASAVVRLDCGHLLHHHCATMMSSFIDVNTIKCPNCQKQLSINVINDEACNVQ